MISFLHQILQDTILQEIHYLWLNIWEEHLSHCKSFQDKSLCLQGISESHASSKKINNIFTERGQVIIYKVWEKIFIDAKIIL